jgi:NADPH:quinone reductase-like Zn-dependent oxidoreductase
MRNHNAKRGQRFAFFMIVSLTEGMANSLQGKIVLITGASSGFGEDAARLFAKEGCQVVLAAR